MRIFNPYLTAFAAASLVLLASCQSSRRKEIEQRKAALEQKVSDELLRAQAELASVDTMLERVQGEYSELKAKVDADRANLCATEDDLRRVNLLRKKRDSLQVRFEACSEEIKAIHRKHGK